MADSMNKNMPRGTQTEWPKMHPMKEISPRGRGSMAVIKAPWKVACRLCSQHHDVATRGIPSAHSQWVGGPIAECHMAAWVVPAGCIRKIKYFKMILSQLPCTWLKMNFKFKKFLFYSFDYRKILIFQIF